MTIQTPSHPLLPHVDSPKFLPLTPQQLSDILGLTIKHDDVNKLVAFLCALSAYTEDSQLNVSFNAPSSTGKSYIPTEIARLFPQEDVKEYGYCSPKAFYHEAGEFDKEKKQYVVDLSRKILIFLDQPHDELLTRLRPVLSHDKKEIAVKIADTVQKEGFRTKNIVLRGYPAVIFCTAKLHIDEQEATRFILLSPEVGQDKIREGITTSIRREADRGEFNKLLEENPDRALLKERILAIKMAGIKEIRISSQENVERKFFSNKTTLQPRHLRDIKRAISLTKTFALLNFWWRERHDSTIIANDADIDSAFELWAKISVSQDLNIPPYIYHIYQDVILPAWQKKNERVEGHNHNGMIGLTRPEVYTKHYEVYNRPLDPVQFRQYILPMLGTAGLIYQVASLADKRNMLIFPSAHRRIDNTVATPDAKSGNNNKDSPDPAD